jgi:hypothetical protein
MNETQYHSLAHLPGGIRTAAAQRLDAGEQVRHALLLEQYPDAAEAWPATPATALALVITDRQLLRLAGGPPHLPATGERVVTVLYAPAKEHPVRGWRRLRAAPADRPCAV